MVPNSLRVYGRKTEPWTLFLLQLSRRSAIFTALELLNPQNLFSDLIGWIISKQMLWSARTFFHLAVSITIHTKCIHNNVLEAWGSVPKSRNRIRGHFAEWVYILSFSACQTAYIHQVSCWYHILHDSCVKLPHYAWKWSERRLTFGKLNVA